MRRQCANYAPTVDLYLLDAYYAYATTMRQVRTHYAIQYYAPGRTIQLLCTTYASVPTVHLPCTSSGTTMYLLCTYYAPDKSMWGNQGKWGGNIWGKHVATSPWRPSMSWGGTLCTASQLIPQNFRTISGVVCHHVFPHIFFKGIPNFTHFSCLAHLHKTAPKRRYHMVIVLRQHCDDWGLTFFYHAC